MVQTFAVFVDDPTTVKIKTVKVLINSPVGDIIRGCGIPYGYRVPPYLAHDLQCTMYDTICTYTYIILYS